MPTTLINIGPANECEPVAGPSSGRAFAEPPEPDTDEPVPDLATLVRRVRGAKRIVVVCGAGVSTAAAIPDFRSASGLFSGSKGHGVKDLFHVKSLSSAALLPDHHALLNDLCERATSAGPTSFHQLLAALDTDGRLLRVYTQNIDGLEARAGLATGIPPQRARTSRKGKERAGATVSATDTPANTPTASSEVSSALGDLTPDVADPPSHPPAPRCIPLHGLLDNLHCSLCSTKVPIIMHLPLPPQPIPCPTCDLAASLRSALAERQRRVGTLRASVVLYGEEHPEGDLIGAVVERDLRGTGRRGEREGKADLLLVAGTSLTIPGVKRIVKEMAKCLSVRPAASVRDGKESAPIRTIFLNAEPPSKPGEWDGVFDVWVRGDIQAFADLVGDESFALSLPPTPNRTPRKKSAATTPAGTPTKIKVEEMEASTTGLLTPESAVKQPRKRKPAAAAAVEVEEQGTPTKKRKPALPLTPRPTPPRKPQGAGARADATSKSKSAEKPKDAEAEKPKPKPRAKAAATKPRATPIKAAPKAGTKAGGAKAKVESAATTVNKAEREFPPPSPQRAREVYVDVPSRPTRAHVQHVQLPPCRSLRPYTPECDAESNNERKQERYGHRSPHDMMLAFSQHSPKHIIHLSSPTRGGVSVLPPPTPTGDLVVSPTHVEVDFHRHADKVGSIGKVARPRARFSPLPSPPGF